MALYLLMAKLEVAKLSPCMEKTYLMKAKWVLSQEQLVKSSIISGIRILKWTIQLEYRC
jgi:hypothetical protein